ncbi:MAG: hypothetical protein R3301_13165 [Saprospiraceae bacterium]|nr:hypothetical protein [Saprospiraceae bacterium]
MKRFEEQAREAMQDWRQPVDPEHVRQFEVFLKAQKRRRRGLLVLLVGAGLMILGGTAIGLLKQNSAQPVPEQHMAAAPNANQVEASRDHRALPESQLEAVTTRRPPSASTAQTAQLAREEPVVRTEGVTATAAGTPYDQVIVAEEPSSLQQVVVAGEPPELTPQSTPQVTRSTVAGMDQLDGIVPAVLATGARALPDIEAIAALPHKAAWFGILADWMTTSAAPGGLSADGFGGHLGVFASLPISGPWYLGLEAGWQYLERGFAFDKQSVTTSFGFGQRSEANTLTIRSMYSWYAAAMATLQLARHQIDAGVSAYHVYGARGDVVRRIDETSQSPVTNTLKDVWVSTDGLATVTTELMIGYRYRAFDHLSLAVRLRLPVTDVIAANPTETYAYRGGAYRTGLQAGLYYHFND